MPAEAAMFAQPLSPYPTVGAEYIRRVRDNEEHEVGRKLSPEGLSADHVARLAQATSTEVDRATPVVRRSTVKMAFPHGLEPLGTSVQFTPVQLVGLF
ncbi:hypothetical protein BN2476_930050 [Paraburkholderia piptadeniae]|uniref:Uncharacterized protein n=1 Tax=Paraburkholderia piptadeniae TaxID=1701573 RepID=A0A1N7STU0_9BURK|nr:hypothetical protein BN2476_930050 [Paraburkholderia piptadeniae]